MIWAGELLYDLLRDRALTPVILSIYATLPQKVL